MRKSGWYGESRRHSLASLGIETGKKIPVMIPAKPIKQLEGQAPFWDNLWKQNKGVFYRGTSGTGTGLGFGVLGDGLYVTWDRGIARAFGEISGKGRGFQVNRYRLPRDLKLMDYQGNECWEIRKNMGIQNRWDKIGDPMFSRIFTFEIKKRGYDGVISDNKADGIVVFDSTKVKRV